MEAAGYLQFTLERPCDNHKGKTEKGYYKERMLSEPNWEGVSI